VKAKITSFTERCDTAYLILRASGDEPQFNKVGGIAKHTTICVQKLILMRL